MEQRLMASQMVHKCSLILESFIEINLLINMFSFNAFCIWFLKFCAWLMFRLLLVLGKRHAHLQILALFCDTKGKVHGWSIEFPRTLQGISRYSGSRKHAWWLQLTSTSSTRRTIALFSKILMGWWYQEVELLMANDHLLGHNIIVQKLGYAIHCP